MQYDLRRSGASKKSKGQAGSSTDSPLLRERLIDVVRRDRAVAAIAHAQRQAERDAERRDELDFEDDPDTDVRHASELGLEAKSGTHARMPGYPRVEDRVDEGADEDGLMVLDRPVQRIEPMFPIDEEFDSDESSLFATWIEEEIIEIDEASDIPIEFMAEPPPVPAVALARAQPPSIPPELTEPPPPDQGLELMLEADAEPAQREPIRTRTMARLLASHGYAARALSIYDELLAATPDDASLRAEADGVRKKKK